MNDNKDNKSAIVLRSLDSGKGLVSPSDQEFVCNEAKIASIYLDLGLLVSDLWETKVRQ